MKLQKETKPHGKWYDDACGTAFALELVGERWSLLIVRELMFGPRRFTDLRGGLPAISAKVLAERLEGLERAGIVCRLQLPPPAASQVYALTELGYAADGAIMELGRWAARSPAHDPTLPLSAASLMMSFRTMFDAARAGSLVLAGAMTIGKEHFSLGVSEGGLTVARGTTAGAQFAMAAPSAMPIAAAVYGKVPLAALAAQGFTLAGDETQARRFVDLFHLPPKLG